LRKILRIAVIALPALGVIAVTWVGTLSAITAQRQEARARVLARVANQAASFQQDVQRQVLELDQTLRILIGGWQADPAHFDITTWRDRAIALSDISHDLLLADNHGRIVQSTVPEAVGASVANEDYFRYALKYGRAQTDAFVGAATVDPILRQWHMEVARWTQAPDGSFAGVMVADWRISAIEDLFRSADLGARPLVELVGLNDGKLRAIVGPANGIPDQRIADSGMFRALKADPNGTWVGPSAPDNLVRVHAFRQLPGRDLAVVVGLDYDAALAPSAAWATEARLFATIISVLLLILGWLIWRGASQARRREHSLGFERAMLAAANAQLEVAKTHADAKTAQLQATLEGMTDGVAMMDAQLCLVEWNRQFPEVAGVPADLLRVGLPMEDILRAQARSGQFGRVDIESEVARRMSTLRSGDRIGTAQRIRPDGRAIELRRNRLPDGGFVTLYTDVTARKKAEDALRDARAVAEAATEAKSRFVAIVSHEIRTPLNALLSTLTLLHEARLPAGQQVLLDTARQSGDALLGLINDILEMSRMEAGQLTLRPSIFALRGLLDGVIDIFRAQAAERRIELRLALSPDLPGELYADPGRLRQVLINLLSNAVKFGQAGAVGLLAGLEHDGNGRPMLHLAVRDGGPVIEPEGRARLFRPFTRLESAESSLDEPVGSGLGLAICRQLVALMGGTIGCDPWIGEDGKAGNEFWLRVPIAAVPASARHAPTAESRQRRILPRTRVLLVEDILANQLVTATMLRREGHQVDIASDGARALRMIAQEPYDLVFLDIFMPGMSGFDVARRIRAMPAPAAAVPLVALTANVSPDDQALCREAGMSRLLGKPVSLPELLQAIGDLVWHGMPVRAAEVTSASTTVQPAPVLSSERIDELRNSLPGEMLGGMVEECLIELQARLPALRRAMLSGNNADVASQAHAMVGMAAGYGMSSLEARLRGLMNAARGNDAGRVAALARELDVELSMAATALREALAIEMV
jgi:signal transduction histidine kinase/DNA-binding NarL/FixJ family response regulator